MEKSTIQLPDTWLEHLKEEFNQDYMIKLKSKLLELKKNKIKFNTSCPVKVAKYGYEALKANNSVSIPGYFNKFLVFLNRLLPRNIVTKIVRYIQEKNRN